jgi:hypothetical protein
MSLSEDAGNDNRHLERVVTRTILPLWDPSENH